MNPLRLLDIVLRARVIASDPAAAANLHAIRDVLYVDGRLSVQRLAAMAIILGILGAHMPRLLAAALEHADHERAQPVPTTGEAEVH